MFGKSPKKPTFTKKKVLDTCQTSDLDRFSHVSTFRPFCFNFTRLRSYFSGEFESLKAFKSLSNNNFFFDFWGSVTRRWWFGKHRPNREIREKYGMRRLSGKCRKLVCLLQVPVFDDKWWTVERLRFKMSDSWEPLLLLHLLHGRSWWSNNR